MKVSIEKVGENRYILQKEETSEKVGREMSKAEMMALILDKIYSPKVEKLLDKVDEKYAARAQAAGRGDDEKDRP